jgi:integration host factor subunit alpha
MIDRNESDAKTLTKADIVESVHRQIGFSKKDSSEITEKVFEAIKRSLERGEYVKLSGFGKFEVRQKRKRRGRNPQTGEEIEITARKVLSFKASQILRQTLAKSKIAHG